MRRLLSSRGRTDLCEGLLNVLGAAEVSREAALAYLGSGTQAVARAMQVHKTPHPFGAKMRPHTMPYAIDGAREMIDSGYHRESLPWILIVHSLSAQVLAVDAPPDEREQHELAYARLLASLGLETLEDCRIRAQAIQEYTSELFPYCDQLAIDSIALQANRDT
jgi:hypothetical protein